MNAPATKAKPTSENGRVRSYLTEREVEKLIAAARKHSRYGARDGRRSPLAGVEIRALRALRSEHPDSRYVFVTERGGPMMPDGFTASVGERLPGNVRYWPILLQKSPMRDASCGPASSRDFGCHSPR